MKDRSIQEQRKDIEFLLAVVDSDKLHGIDVCQKHGGVGFVSDCVVCKKLVGIKERCGA